MFSRQHYTFLADFFANASLCVEPRDRRLVASALADRLGADNPRFDRRRFLIAAKAYLGNDYTDGGISPIDGQYFRNAAE